MSKTKDIKEEDSLAVISSNPALEALFKENAEVGSKGLASALPLLKVHTTGRSGNELALGGEPQDGHFFYTPTKEEFESVDCHILSVSEGFRAKAMQGTDDKFNQIVAGTIITDEGYKPFLMYFTGVKLQNLWKFGKEAHGYTHLKPIPIPLFALKIKLTTEKVTTKFGKSWAVKFEILRGMNGFPLVEMDVNKVKQLRIAVEKAEDTCSSLIESKAVLPEVEEKPEDLLADKSLEDTSNTEDVIPLENEEKVNPDDIPF